jgi:hypothetical protein
MKKSFRIRVCEVGFIKTLAGGTIMIFETLAAMADYNNNLKFDNDASLSECAETIGDLEEVGKLNTNSDTTTMNLSNGKTRVTTNIKYLSDTYFIHALQHKTPRSEFQPSLDIFDNKVIEY